MKEPVDHILRPRLPWRTDDDTALTECGYDASKVKAITREEFTERYKEWGSQRTAMVTCMTCIRTARNWGTWEERFNKTRCNDINLNIPACRFFGNTLCKTD